MHVGKSAHVFVFLKDICYNMWKYDWCLKQGETLWHAQYSLYAHTCWCMIVCAHTTCSTPTPFLWKWKGWEPKGGFTLMSKLSSTAASHWHALEHKNPHSIGFNLLLSKERVRTYWIRDRWSRRRLRTDGIPYSKVSASRNLLSAVWLSCGNYSITVNRLRPTNLRDDFLSNSFSTSMIKLCQLWISCVQLI
jgi:hypothetical protein